MFAGPLAEVLGNGKYTEWVLRRDFTEDHLLCLLCMVGEFDTHAPDVMRLLWQNASRLKGETRSVLALEALHCIVRGERFDRYEWSRRMTSGGPIRREVGDLPEPVRDVLGAAAPRATWDLVMAIAEGYELGGKDVAGRKIYAYFSPEGRAIHVGPERRRGEATKPSFFSAALAEMIERSSRARWATARVCSEDHVLCLLWLVAEFAARAPGVLCVLEEHRAELADGGRLLTVLNAMCRMASGMSSIAERFDVDELDRRIGRGRAHLEFGDLPEPVRARLSAASPGTRWKFVLMTPEGYELGGEETSGRFIEPAVSRSGEVVFKLNVPWDAVPATVAGAVKARFPDFQMPWAYARLAADGTIAAYEIVHVPRTGTARRTQRIAIGPDGTEIPVSTD